MISSVFSQTDVRTRNVNIIKAACSTAFYGAVPFHPQHGFEKDREAESSPSASRTNLAPKENNPEK